MRIVKWFIENRDKRYKECKCCKRKYKIRRLVKFGEDDWFCSERCFTKYIMDMPLVDMIRYVEKDSNNRRFR